MKVWATPEQFAPHTCGFVLAASGRKYATLAEQAARSLKQSNPEFDVDLFTDVSVESGLFTNVHELEETWFRPKFEALLRSRFDRSIYLDCDLVVLADLSDVFWLLNRFEIAAAHAPTRNAYYAQSCFRTPLPNSFPQVNTGVFGVRNCDATRSYLEACRAIVRDNALPRDQYVMRELLWEMDIKLAVLPPEYNIRDIRHTLVNGSEVGAPRVLHHSAFRRRMDDVEVAPTPREIFGEVFLRHVDNLLQADQTFWPGNDHRVRTLPSGALKALRKRTDAYDGDVPNSPHRDERSSRQYALSSWYAACVECFKRTRT